MKSGASDPRLRRQLGAFRGQRLAQYSIGRAGIRLSFWGEAITAIGREILIEEEMIEITQAGQPPQRVPSRSELTAITLLNSLDQPVSHIQIREGHLGLSFDNSVQLSVAPHPQWEAWQISSDGDLLIVCTPAGDLTIWYPGHSHSRPGRAV